MLNQPSFDNEFKKSLITNCGIEVWGLSTSVPYAFVQLLSEENIESFSLTRRNYGVCESVPNDTCSFTILNWNSLSNNTKNYFKFIGNDVFNVACGNPIYIRFSIGNNVTNEAIAFRIDNCEIDELRNKATITCEGLYSFEAQLTYYLLLSGLIKVEVAPDLPPELDIAPPICSLAEYKQHIAIGLGKGLRKISHELTSEYITGDIYNDEYVDIVSNSPVMVLDLINVKNYQKTNDQQNRSNVKYYGMKLVGSEIEGIGLGHNTPNQTTRSNFSVYAGFNDISKQWYVSNCRCTSGGNTDWFDYIKKSAGVTAKWNRYPIYPSTDTNYYITLDGYEVQFNSPENNQSFIKCVTLLETSTQFTTAQSNARQYYSYNYIEIDCRIDPRIEPLDKIFIDTLGVICVERVKIDFNGGFNGKISGRIISNTLEIQDPEVHVDDYTPNTFRFRIINNNPFPCEVIIAYSNFYQPYTFTIPARSTLNCDRENCPLLYASFEAYYYGDLQDYVTCRFESDYGDSGSEIILEANN